MKRRDCPLYLLILIPALALCAFTAAAQTCRIACGVSHNGQSTYREVYEYDFVTDKPSFPGGSTALLEFVNHTREYPSEAYSKGIQGRVTCQFVVNSDGTVTDIQLLRGIEPSLNREAIRIFSLMPDWKPGRHNGRCVPVRVIWSVPFRR